MPIYEYQCQACGHQLEAFQKMSDQPLVDCPVCHQTTLQKLISAAGFQLKGTGWYATDFRNKTQAESKSSQAKEGPASNESKTSDSGTNDSSSTTGTSTSET